jgi:hypothetical protein
MAYSAPGTNDLCFAASTLAGQTWQQGPIAGNYTRTTPAMCRLGDVNDGTTIVYVASDGTNALYQTTRFDNGSWPAAGGTKTGHLSAVAPALCAYNGTLYLAYVAEGTSKEILVATASPYTPETWSNYTSSGRTSSMSPALCVFQGKLTMAWIASDGTSDIYVASSTNGTAWENVVNTGHTSPFPPSLAVQNINGQMTLVLGFVGTGGSNELYVSTTTSAALTGWSKATPPSTSLGVQTSGNAPVLDITSWQEGSFKGVPDAGY